MRRDDNAGAEAMRVCSACDGDYEDPERTAWRDDDDEDPEQSNSDLAERGAARERFPVREE